MARGDGRVYQNNGSKNWWVQFYVRGKLHRESAKSPDRADAQRLLRKRLAQADQGASVTPTRLTLRRLTDIIITEYKVNGRATGRRMAYGLKHIVDYLGEKTIALSVSTSSIRKFIDHRQAQGAANGTINRELAALKRAFSLAVKDKLIVSAPHFPMLPEATPREGFLEPADFDAVRAKLPDYLHDVLTFLYVSGWRTGEVKGLPWSEVDKDLRMIRLSPKRSKTKKGRLLPITGELAEIMARAKAARRPDCPYVFHRNGHPFRDWRGAWSKAVEAAGLVNQLVHDFRRSTVRNLVRAGVPEKVAMELTGHKTRSVFDRYHIVSESDLLNAVKRRDQFLAEAPTERKVEPITQAKDAG